VADEDPLNVAVDATLARMAALKEADQQLTRRRLALRRMHTEQHLAKAEVARRLVDALRDRGLTSDELRDAGVAHESVMKALREP
jgi:predicted nucleic acid-binding protein